MKTIAFFSNTGGVGQTSLVYHLAWMYSYIGFSVVVADLDPQANLTSMFLEDEHTEALWSESERKTIYGAFQPLLDGSDDIPSPHLEEIEPDLRLLAGDLCLAQAEDELSSQWSACLDGKPRAFGVLSGLGRVLELAAKEVSAHLVLIDVGPNLSALNRAALVAAHEVVIPVAPDIYSLQGLRNLGPTLRRWRKEWGERYERAPDTIGDLSLPNGAMNPAGYVVLQHAIRLDRPVYAYARWRACIPGEYWRAVLGKEQPQAEEAAQDIHCLATLKPYRSLMPFAREARKPIFLLKPADGAIGGHAQAVQDGYSDFSNLAKSIANRCEVILP